MLAQKILREGGVVKIDDVSFVIDGDGEISIGDVYIAERNTGPKLLTAKEIDPRMWIVPQESSAYFYDVWECVKVRLADE